MAQLFMTVPTSVTASRQAKAHRSIHHQDVQIQATLVGVDLLVITVSALVASTARTRLPWFPDTGDLGPSVLVMAIPAIALWMVLLGYLGSYRIRQLGGGVDEFRRVCQASFVTAAALGVSAYLLQNPLSRGFFFLFFLIGVPSLVLERLALRRLLTWSRAQGHLKRTAILAGSEAHINDVLRVLARESWLGYDVVALLTPTGGLAAKWPNLPVLGTPQNAPTALRSVPVSTIIFAEGSFDRAADFSALARELESEEVDLIVVPSLTDVAAGRTDIRPVAGMSMVHVERPQASRSASWHKRAFDIVGSLLLIIVLSPVFLAAAIAVKATDGGRIIFRQRRVGTHGEIFEFFKFRSMVVNAEELKAQLMSDNGGVLFKMKDDPRITRVGKILRRYSIDELPQLFNVLRGDMSLVGPRPALEKEVAQYDHTAMRRLDVRPGMTGLWQVSGRSNLSWEDTVRLDCYYCDNWSFLQDVNILLRTFKAVFAHSGAY